MPKNVAEQVVEMLIAAGVKRIYAVTGDSLNEVNDAVRRSDNQIQWIHMRHEEAGAYAAAAESELALAGDGGLSMLLGDLSTIVQYKLPVKLLYLIIVRWECTRY